LTRKKAHNEVTSVHDTRMSQLVVGTIF
jgi:hypothetical protein